MVRVVGDGRTGALDRLHRIRDRHFDCYVELARAANESDVDEQVWFEVLDSELANLRSALEWGFTTGRVETAAFAASLEPYWLNRRRFSEGRQILDRALRLPHLLPSDRIDGLLAVGSLVWTEGLWDVAQERYTAARRLATSLGDQRRKAQAARRLGWCLYVLLLPERAEETFAEALELSHLLSPAERADTLRGLGGVRTLQADFQGAIDLHRQARELLEEVGDAELPIQYMAEVNLLVQAGRLQDALTLADKSLDFARGQGDLLQALMTKAQVAEALDDRHLLLRVLDEGIDVARAGGRTGVEAILQDDRAGAALGSGDVGAARQAIDRALGLLETMEAMSIHERNCYARLLVKRARLAEDDGELDLAEELLRQGVAVYSGWSPGRQAEQLAELARLLDRHGDAARARLTMNQAVGLTAPGGRPSALDLRSALAEVDDDLEAALRYSVQAIAEPRVQYPDDFPATDRRRAALLAELGRLEEALGAATEAVESQAESPRSPGRARSHVVRARVRIAAGDTGGAREDMSKSTRLAEIAWGDDQLQLATTLARLALMDGRRDRAVDLWSAVRDFRAATTRVLPRLSHRFETPLTELETRPDGPVRNARAALDALRSLVGDELAGLGTPDQS
jgi:tetratricopeptide (TPR) repeat protein